MVNTYINAAPNKPGIETTHEGGVAFTLSIWDRLVRVLILGTASNTFYTSAADLTDEATGVINACITEDGPRTVQTIIEVAAKGRAYKTDPAIYALSRCLTDGDLPTRRLASDAISVVCRTGTHLLHLAAMLHKQRGWGAVIERGFARWYNAKPVDQLAYQLVKYRDRDGWTHRDILRLAHLAPRTDAVANVLNYALRGYSENGTFPMIIHGVEYLKTLDKAEDAARIIADYHIPREAVPSHFLTSPLVWDALLQDMPITAMVRNLATMTRVGLIRGGTEAERSIAAALRDEARLKSLHPMQVLLAMTTYASGVSFRGDTTWTPSEAILEALDDAFYGTFGNVPAIGKETILAVDSSASMGSRMHDSALTYRQAAAALAMIAAHADHSCTILCFDTTIKEVKLRPTMRLDAVTKAMSFAGSGTYTALVPQAIVANQLPCEVLCWYTDGETASKDTMGLLDHLRHKGLQRSVAYAMTPTSRGLLRDAPDWCLNVVGFDAAAPALATMFARGEL